MNKALILISLAASALAYNDICKHPDYESDAKKNPRTYADCHAFIQAKTGAFSVDEIKKIGVASDVCKSLTIGELQALEANINGKGKNLIETLPYKCVKLVAEAGAAKFNQVFASIKTDDKKIESFMKKNSSSICAQKKRFDGTDITKALKTFCEHRKNQEEIDDIKGDNDKLREELEKLKAEEAKAAAKKNSAENGKHLASSTVLLLISVFFGIIA